MAKKTKPKSDTIINVDLLNEIITARRAKTDDAGIYRWNSNLAYVKDLVQLAQMVSTLDPSLEIQETQYKIGVAIKAFMNECVNAEIPSDEVE